jgi:hypothetical protein
VGLQPLATGRQGRLPIRLIAILALAACGASGQQQRLADRRLDEIKSTYPCVDTAKVRITTTDSDIARGSCWLVGVALQEIASGHARPFGVNPADTALVTSARMGQFHFAGLQGAPDEWYWWVLLSISGQPRNLEVHIQQLTKGIIVRAAEGPNIK